MQSFEQQSEDILHLLLDSKDCLIGQTCGKTHHYKLKLFLISRDWEFLYNLFENIDNDLSSCSLLETDVVDEFEDEFLYEGVAHRSVLDVVEDNCLAKLPDVVLVTLDHSGEDILDYVVKLWLYEVLGDECV